MATEPEAYQPDALAEEKPRYLRRQRPLEIRQRRFGRRSWQVSKRVLAGGAAVLAGGWLFYETYHFLLHSPRVILARPEQIELSGNHHVNRRAVVEKFYPDRGCSVLRVPLAERRAALEEIPWVEQATVQRVLPNRVLVELVERTPVAFLRQGTELGLVDAYGVILGLPAEGQFHLPVVEGITKQTPREERERRMKLYVQFLREIELVRPGAAERVSEVDLSDSKDLRTTLAGIPETGGSGAADAGGVVVHFGDGDFVNRFRLYVENIGQWRASVGGVNSVDLRFARQVVVNPKPKTTAGRATGRPEVAGKPH